MKQRLLVFHPALAPYRIDFFNALVERYDLHLVLLGENLQEQKFDQQALVRKLKCRLSYLLDGFVFRSRYIRTGVIRLLRCEKPQVVLSYEYSLTTMALALYRRLSRARFALYTMTDDNAELFAKCSGLRRRIRDFLLRQLDGCLVIDAEVGPLMTRIVTPKQLDVVTVPIIYDENSFRRDERQVFEQAEQWRQRNLRLGEKAVFFVGRLEPVKNLPWLIECASQRSWPANARLFVVGEGSLRAELERMVEKWNLGRRVSFLGRFEGAELQPFFAAADALILCSVSETFGAVVSEGLHWGALAFVSSHVGAKTLIRECDNGAVFELENPDRFLLKLADGLTRQEPWVKGRPSLVPVRLQNAVARFAPQGG